MNFYDSVSMRVVLSFLIYSLSLISLIGCQGGKSTYQIENTESYEELASNSIEDSFDPDDSEKQGVSQVSDGKALEQPSSSLNSQVEPKKESQSAATSVVTLSLQQILAELQLSYPGAFDRTLRRIAMDLAHPQQHFAINGIREDVSLDHGPLIGCPAGISFEDCAFNKCMEIYDCNAFHKNFGTPGDCAFNSNKYGYRAQVLPNLGNGYGPDYLNSDIRLYWPFYYPKSATVIKERRGSNSRTYQCNFDAVAEYQFIKTSN